MCVFMDSLGYVDVCKFSNYKNEKYGIKCKSCLIKRSKFYCQYCVKNGDFTDSKKLQCPERYAEKSMKLIVEKRKKLNIGVAEKLLEYKEIDNLKQEIKTKKERIKLMKSLITSKKNERMESIERLKKFRSWNEKKRNKNENIAKNICTKKQRSSNLNDKLMKRKTMLNSILSELSSEILSQVHSLIKYIFPLEEVQRRSTFVTDTCEISNTCSQLDDAARTAYVNGKWVQVTNEESYRIVLSELPSSGNYNSYQNWINTYGLSGANLEFGFKNCYHRISSALTYTSQFLSVLAYIFNVKLPHRLCYSEFGLNLLCEEKFTYKIAKLNANIMYLCLAQGIDSECVHPRRTLSNLAMLFDEKYCRYRETKDLCPDRSIVDVLEEQLVADLNSAETDESDDEYYIRENLDISPDWETIPQAFASDDSTTSTYQQSSTVYNPGFTESIVSSAAASVVSLWKGYTGQK